MPRSIEEIEKDLESVENRIFHEEMADFMDWDAYNKFNARKQELKKELEEAKAAEEEAKKWCM